jgi:CO/xanthine dehydrogenase Mo-binding subunit
MRAPGAAQAIFNIECIMDHIASVLKIPGDVVRERNFYKGGETTPYGQKVPRSLSELTLRAVWDEVSARWGCGPHVMNGECWRVSLAKGRKIRPRI